VQAADDTGVLVGATGAGVTDTAALVVTAG